jgi:hypothetical protein
MKIISSTISRGNNLNVAWQKTYFAPIQNISMSYFVFFFLPETYFIFGLNGFSRKLRGRDLLATWHALSWLNSSHKD